MMKAVVLKKTCEADDLKISSVPVPVVKPGWALVKVHGFGINRAELIMRRYEGDASYISLPRILGIECAGEIYDPSGSSFIKGERVIALMGGMGRSFDGSYAEYALLPVKNVFRVNTGLEWEELSAIPETYFTVYGSLFESLQLKSSDTLLVRGGTSSAGLVAIQIASHIGCTVLATSRNKEKLPLLKDQGAAYALLDDGTLSEKVHAVFPRGVDKVLDLVGPSSIQESMQCLVHSGYICVTGILGAVSVLDNFDPIKDIPNGIYLCSFFSNYPTQTAVDSIFSLIEKYNLKPPIARVFSFDQIAKAHSLVERNEANGKVVVMID